MESSTEISVAISKLRHYKASPASPMDWTQNTTESNWAKLFYPPHKSILVYCCELYPVTLMGSMPTEQVALCFFMEWAQCRKCKLYEHLYEEWV